MATRKRNTSKLRSLREGTVAEKAKTAASLAMGEQATRSRTVHGQLRYSDGRPASASIVRALDKSLRAEALLGDSRTDAVGKYQIDYQVGRLQPRGKAAADLIVRAYDRAGKELAHSDLICRAPADATVDLVVGNVPLHGPSEHDQLLKAVRPYLGGTKLADLKREDVAFLSCSANIDRVRLATLVVASRLARDTGLPDWLFYALGRQGVQLQLIAMLALTVTHLKEALDRAMAGNVVALVDERTEGALLDRLHAALLKEAFREDPPPGAFSAAAWLETTVTTVSTDRGMQQEFYSRWFRRTTLAGFWKELEDDPRFAGAVIEDLRFTLMLGRLTGYLMPVLQQLKHLRQREELARPTDLAKLTRPRWREMLRSAANGGELDLPEDVPGATHAERLENYISRIREAIETMLPGESLRVTLLEASETPEGLRQLLRNHDSIDLHRDNIDAKLAERGAAVFEGIAEDERDSVVQHAKALQRLVRLSPHPDHVRVLHAAGFDSAYSIARTPKQRFNQLFAEAARGLWDSLDGAYSVQAPARGGGS